jgi:4-diphosphocytidyl-2C-methyl-D-erythritol kinase
LQAGASGALLSGSGASVFAIFDNIESRQQAIRLFGQNEPTWRVFECETISSAEYQKQLEPCWNLLEELS